MGGWCETFGKGGKENGAYENGTDGHTHTYNSTQTLFCNVKPLRTIRVVIAASEKFAQDRVISATFEGSSI
jgi:hypothetical protein